MTHVGWVIRESLDTPEHLVGDFAYVEQMLLKSLEAEMR
jgi:hypothetical protein